MISSPDKPRDEGFGIIELIVAIVVSGIILTAIASILVNSWKTQEDVLSVSESTNRGQLVGSMVERAVRNARFVDVSTDGTTLRVLTSLSGGLKCQGFAVIGGEVKVSANAGTLPATWPVWAPPISPSNIAPYFAQSVDGVVTYKLDLDTDSSPVRISGAVVPRSALLLTNGGCW